LATKWLWQYNNERPHSAIGGIPPRYLMKQSFNNSTSKCC
ncbi:MAG: integrase core domain-containing protein, partial [Saezia sp.]